MINILVNFSYLTFTNINDYTRFLTVKRLFYFILFYIIRKRYMRKFACYIKTGENKHIV